MHLGCSSISVIFNNVCLYLYVCLYIYIVFNFFGALYIEIELLGGKETLCLMIWGHNKMFLKVLQFYQQPMITQAP